MASTHKPFRELIKPGSNFEFVGRTRVWVLISALLLSSSIGMLFVNKAWRGDYLNWTIDFKGGTEMRFGFRDTQSGERKQANVGDVRAALESAGFLGIEVSGFQWDEENAAGEQITAQGMLVRTPSFGAVSDADSAKLIDSFSEHFKDNEMVSVRWSGDRLFVRSKKPLVEDDVAKFLEDQGKEMKPWDAEQKASFTAVDESSDEYLAQVAIYGIERQFANAIEEATAGLKVELFESYAVGARAGAELRNDGITSLFYAMALIMLYLAFRFDIRYAPGAVVALLHDVTLVVGAFAFTYTEFSLTTVAALLTVIGYSVNDTVIIFDRIRENVERLKDKKLARIINISINETLGRSILTSSTLFAVTLSMNLLGTGIVRDFAFAMNVGVVVGTYSSIFIASPIVLLIDTRFYTGRAPQKGKAAGNRNKAGKTASKAVSKASADDET